MHNPNGIALNDDVRARPNAQGCIKWLLFIAIAGVVVYLTAIKTPNGYQIVLLNFSGENLRNVEIKLPWGEYHIKELDATSADKPWQHQKVLFHPFWMGDAVIHISATTASGKKIAKASDSFYFQGASDSSIIIDITFDHDGVIHARERRVRW